MRVEYQKTKLSYGGYRPGRVIWIKLLNGQRVAKFNLLDQYGSVLFSVGQKSDKVGEIENILTYGTITEEQIKDIQGILTRNEPCYDWYHDDLCDIDFYEVGSITRETIENKLVQKLLEHKDYDMLEMKIIENGQMDSYLLEFEERGD